MALQRGFSLLSRTREKSAGACRVEINVQDEPSARYCTRHSARIRVIDQNESKHTMDNETSPDADIFPSRPRE